MKKKIVIGFLTLLFSCAGISKVASDGKSYIISKDLNNFFTSFETSVTCHNQAKLLTLLNPDYKKAELMGTYQGDTEPFFRAFFCGTDLKTKMITCPNFNEVLSIKFIGLSEVDTENYIAEYEVKTRFEILNCKWRIKNQTINGENSFSVLSSFGYSDKIVNVLTKQ